MMKSMTYKIGPINRNHQHIPEKSINETSKIDVIKLNDYTTSDSDSIEKDYEDNSSGEVNLDIQKEDNMSEIVVVANKNGEVEDQRSDHLSNYDTASSGFGTVDEENEHEKNDAINKVEIKPPIIIYQPLQQQQQNRVYTNQLSSSSNNSQQSDNINKYPQPIKLPTLQGPRQIIYELNKNKSEDVTNILHDNSSINSSSSSDDNRRSNCVQSMLNRLNKFYYSCFCCYSSSSHANQNPLCCTWLSIFCCCCPLFGLISLYLTNRSKKLKLNQKYAKAEKYSNYAEKLNIASLICGVIFYAIAVFMITLVIFMYWRHHNTA